MILINRVVFTLIVIFFIYSCEYFEQDQTSNLKLDTMKVLNKLPPGDEPCNNCNVHFANCGMYKCDNYSGFPGFGLTCWQYQSGSCSGTGDGNCNHNCSSCGGMNCGCTVGLCYCGIQ